MTPACHYCPYPVFAKGFCLPCYFRDRRRPGAKPPTDYLRRRKREYQENQRATEPARKAILD